MAKALTFDFLASSFTWRVIRMSFILDHPGAVPISTAPGEELKKLIGAAAYIDATGPPTVSHHSKAMVLITGPVLKVALTMENGSCNQDVKPAELDNLLDPFAYLNVKAVFDAAIKVVLQPPKQREVCCGKVLDLHNLTAEFLDCDTWRDFICAFKYVLLFSPRTPYWRS
ncbi:hypothetical protein CRG98_026682 [Punica granatum]|uniref:Uncharacterized protein n=1 Tax=Punica granatum TaxID=22663 RepID=A0A2I0J9B6_PUNGR|nr:hypothetical protein CRG98_026682 [Punica granatum]